MALPFWFDDASHDINVHGRHSLELPLRVINDRNEPETLAGRALFFEVAKVNATDPLEALLRLPLEAHSSASIRLIRVTALQLRALALKGRRHDWLVRDETPGISPQVLLAGKFCIYGPVVPE
jgi:hypothetical protein